MPDEIDQQSDLMSLSKLSGALGSLQCDSPDRQETLEQLSSAIDGDVYQVDALVVSENLISESLK